MERIGRSVGLLPPGLGRPGAHLPLLVDGIELLPHVLQQLGGSAGIGPGQERSDGGGDGTLVQRDVGPAAGLDEGLGGGIGTVPTGHGDCGGYLQVCLLGIGILVGIGNVLGVVLVGQTLGLSDDDANGLIGQHGESLLLAVDGQVEGDAVKVVVVGLGRPVQRTIADGNGVGPGIRGLFGDGGTVGIGHLVQGQGGGIQIGRSADSKEQMRLDDAGSLGLVLGCLVIFQQGGLHHRFVSKSLGQQPPDGLVGGIIILLENNVRSVHADRSNRLDAAGFLRCRLFAVLVAIVILHNGREGGHLSRIAVQIDRHHGQTGHAPHAAQRQVLALVDHVGRQGSERSRRRHARGRTGVRVRVLAVMGVGRRVRGHGGRAPVRGDAGRHGHAAASEAGAASSGRCEAHGWCFGLRQVRAYLMRDGYRLLWSDDDFDVLAEKPTRGMR